ncbi:hypothetical protein ACFOGJ_20070 [Marinibaculum pumilum]|uniref:Uncharacterized protein n=1 Tax=Marinibaculum pumilum TaxID=1766165 RepID=A0ABV7L4C1_9PROT
MTAAHRLLAALLLAGLPLAGTATAAETAAPMRITVGVYFQKDGAYVEQPQELVFETGTACFVWSRQNSPHEALPGAKGVEAVDEPHLHYNAAGKTSFVDSTFRWTEYGPEHEEAAVAARCAADRDGEPDKWVSETDYFREQHYDRPPYFLKIKKVEPL